MAEREYPGNTEEADAERSSAAIRQDIAKGNAHLSQTVGQIGERIKEKLDWREYVNDSPYWAIGTAVGLGYLVSGMFIKRTTPMERIMDSVADEVRDALSGKIVGAAGSGLIRLTLQGIAVKAAVSWIKKAIPAGGPLPTKGRGSTINPKADMSENINIKS